MSGTMEIEKYQRQTKKDRISELVFSSLDGHEYDTSEISNDKILEAMVNHKNLNSIFVKVLHQPKESNTKYRYLYRTYLVAGNNKRFHDSKPNVFGRNNLQNLQNISNINQDPVGNSMGQGMPPNVFANSQR
ncbi:hypothetical protein M9H77_09406 [Catharanthus roseus]|uniref:Uncharacterized protein n=1 Tax=Catharanthus roseus TaxID=4058 RepID=A0ACC0C0N5_CATRO|nr:hypothetical protein M9H77_09406 [Catharanthus roseus]